MGCCSVCVCALLGGRTARLVKLSLYKRVGGSGGTGGGSVPRFGGSPIGTGSAFACPIEEVHHHMQTHTDRDQAPQPHVY
jgi:hypothetical protein